MLKLCRSPITVLYEEPPCASKPQLPPGQTAALAMYMHSTVVCQCSLQWAENVVCVVVIFLPFCLCSFSPLPF